MRRWIRSARVVALVAAALMPACVDDGAGPERLADTAAGADDTAGADTGEADSGEPGDTTGGDGGLSDTGSPDGGDGGDDVGSSDSTEGDADAVGSDIDGGGEPDSDTGGGDWQWPVDTAPIAITPHESWKNTVQYDASEPFVSWGQWDGVQPRWVKFTVLMHDPTKVYFQNSNTYPFHGPFAIERLDPFKGMSVSEFDAVSLHEEGQQAILGAVLLPPTTEGPRELGIQLVRQDAYHREMVKMVFELVRGSVIATEPVLAYYFPSFEQTAQTEQDAEWLAAHDVPVSSAARWAKGDACYSAGWAVGRLVYVPGVEIEAAYGDGTLLPTDILLTDGVPAEVPYVAGIVSLTPSTPNSHVAILASNFGIPFVHLALTASKDQAEALVGQRVAVRTRIEEWSGACSVDVIDIDGIDEPTWELLLARKAVPPLEVTPKKSLGAVWKPVEQLTPADVAYFGGKASNFSLLRKAVPDSSPEAIAISFDLFDAFLAQPTGATTLGEAIDAKLGDLQWPDDIVAAKVALSEVRDMVEAGSFSPAQREAVIAALGSFDPAQRIRFRSSTNVEDSETFTGAGLYDSVSGCLADDLDNDEDGPSLCDATQAKERSVFRAIGKVYASFWNDNAFLERRRRQVDESVVGMAMLVHHSYPDEIELANGVATLKKSAYQDLATLVTQDGAMSVTNPEGGALPEVVQASFSEWGGPYLGIVAYSSLVPLGATVLEWEQEYLDLVALLGSVRKEWEKLPGSGDTYLLDFEYKKVAGGGPHDLQLKQVRAVALPAEEDSAPIQLGESMALCTFQGEYGQVFANHRLKSRWELTARTGLVDSAQPEPLAAHASVTFVNGGAVATLEGAPGVWSASKTTWDGETLVTTFEVDTEAGTSTWRLMGVVPTPSAGQGPLLLLRDLTWTLEVKHPQPVPVFEWADEPTYETTEAVALYPCPAADAPVLPAQTQTYTAGQLSITTSYYWPPMPTGIVAGYTAPLVRWEETTITGLTDEPVLLEGWFSQTYRPEHHNFGEHLVFEPRLEPGIDAKVVQALDAAGARQIFVRGSYGTGSVILIGPDGATTILQTGEPK